jgi:hypothetical protein
MNTTYTITDQVGDSGTVEGLDIYDLETTLRSWFGTDFPEVSKMVDGLLEALARREYIGEFEAGLGIDIQIHR